MFGVYSGSLLCLCFIGLCLTFLLFFLSIWLIISWFKRSECLSKRRLQRPLRAPSLTLTIPAMRLIVLGARSFAGLTTPCRHTSKPEGQRICCRFGQSSSKVGLSEFPRPTTPRTLQSHPTCLVRHSLALFIQGLGPPMGKDHVTNVGTLRTLVSASL